MKSLQLLLLSLVIAPLTTSVSSAEDWIEHPIGGGYSIRYDLILEDFNGDDDLDILVPGAPIGESEYWQNVGDGSYYYRGAPPDMYWCGSADMDGDGDPDVVGFKSELFILEHNGNQPPIIHTISYVDWWRVEACLVDLDQDGDIDIAGGENEVVWFENTGNMQFIEHFIETAEFAGLDVADIDEDGDLDIVLADEYVPVRWLENDGMEQFTLNDLDIYPTDWSLLKNVDMDDDGDLDLVGSYQYLDGGFAWLENFGGMNYSLPHVLDPKLTVHSLEPVDFDGDGDLDLLTAGILWKNMTNGRFCPVKIDAPWDDYGDINQDGLLDVAQSSSFRVSWYEQPPLHGLTAELDAHGQVTLDWMGGPDNLLEFRIYRNGELLATQDGRVYVDQLDSYGSYEYHVVARFTDNPRRAVRAVSVDWPTLTALNLDHDGAGTVQLSWATGGWTFHNPLDDFHQFRIYRDNHLLATTTDTVFTDQLPGMGYHDYRIMAVLDDYEFNLSQPEGIFWTNTDQLLFEDFEDTFHRTWQVANTSATNTWIRVTDGEVYPTAFLRESAPPGCRLVSPPIDISGLSEVEIQYEWRMWEQFYNGEGNSYYGFGPQGPWSLLATHEDEGGGTQSSILSGNELLADTLYLSFRAEYVFTGPGRSDYAKFAIDNISVGPVGARGSGRIGPQEDRITGHPGSCALNQISPNPFNSSTVVSITLPVPVELNVTVFNLAGQQVAKLAQGQYSAGEHQLSFDASGLASGIYFLHATVPGQLDVTRKLVLIQ